MSFLSGLGGGMASGLAGGLSAIGGGGNPLGGAMGGLSGIAGNPMSGIGILKSLFGDGGEAAPAPNAAATGLGKLIGVDPGKISSIAESVGAGMNQIAGAGGAAPGYAASQRRQPQQPILNNHLQKLDPNVIQALIQQFGGGQR